MSATPAPPADSRFLARLVDEAAAPYRPAGRFAWHFARGKLGGDPAYRNLLARGLVPEGARVLDLGCGQGLLANWLRAARQLAEGGDWPAAWPAPARLTSYRGLELMPADVARATPAMPAGAVVEAGDIRHADFGQVDVVLILDVLHYIDHAAQREVLARVRAALAPDGVLLLRVGDADAGLPFRLSNWVDWVVTSVRGHRLGTLYCRGLSQWRALLDEVGLASEAIPMSEGTPFANVMLVARPIGAA